jgi:hypothetical protein
MANYCIKTQYKARRDETTSESSEAGGEPSPASLGLTVRMGSNVVYTTIPTSGNIHQGSTWMNQVKIGQSAVGTTALLPFTSLLSQEPL